MSVDNDSGRRKRQWLFTDEDPLQGVANLFDIAMVFAVALLVSLAMALHLSTFFNSQENATLVINPGTDAMEIISRQGKKLEHYRMSRDTARGQGMRLGTAYRLHNGEVVYVPEKPPAAHGTAPPALGSEHK